MRDANKEQAAPSVETVVQVLKNCGEVVHGVCRAPQGGLHLCVSGRVRKRCEIRTIFARGRHLWGRGDRPANAVPSWGKRAAGGMLSANRAADGTLHDADRRAAG